MLATERQLDYLRSLLSVDWESDPYEMDDSAAFAAYLQEEFPQQIKTPFTTTEEMTSEDCSSIISKITGNE